MLFLVFEFYVGDTSGISDVSKRLFMEADIDPMDAKAILQEVEGMHGYGGGVGWVIASHRWGSV